MSTRKLHPGRELIRCGIHRHSFYPRAAGCSICKMQRRAEQLGVKRFDSEPAASEGSPIAQCSLRDGAAGSVSTDELIELHNALSSRAVQRATATIALIDAALSDDELARKNRHEASALELVGKRIFDALCGPQSRPVNSAFELEVVR